MTPRESILFLDAQLRSLALMLREALRRGSTSRYEVSEILRRVDGEVDAWLEEPDEIRHREVVEIEDALVHGSGGSVLVPRVDVGRRPMEADVRLAAAPDVVAEPAPLPSDAEAHLIDQKARVLGHTIGFLGQTDEERRRLRDRAIARIDLALGGRLPPRHDYGD
ncbi:MAG: hypothetical protein AAGF23_21060 [Acidobacteriota bacterium]